MILGRQDGRPPSATRARRAESRSHLAFALSVALASTFGTSCSSDLGKGPLGASISGEVHYVGTMQFVHPRLLVLATTTLDPAGTPYALVVQDDVDTSQPIPYLLEFLPATSYYVIAVLGEAEGFDPATANRGALPNNCVLAFMPPSRSITLDEADATNQDITIYDSFLADPCFAAGGP